MPQYFVMWVMRGTTKVEADSLPEAERVAVTTPAEGLISNREKGIPVDIEVEDAEELP